MAYLEPSDLAPFADIPEAKALAMIEDAEAQAALAAPCIFEDAFILDGAKVAALRSILRGAVLRWNEAGSGAVTQQQAGPFMQSVDTRQQRRGLFWPSEINDLAALCTTSSSSYTTSLAGADPARGYWSQPNVWTAL